MSSHAGTRNGGMLVARNELSMPKWVTEQTDRIGPKPPAPPVTPENAPTPTKQLDLPPKMKQPEPDYEVIEFSNQQYSNTPLRPSSANSGSKTPDNKLKCTLCGSGNPWVGCDECSQQLFCASCDDMFHKHPKRKGHQRKAIDKSRPPIPPKAIPGQSGPTPPVAPPRRNKRGLLTPLMQRKDQGNTVPGPFPEPTSPTPSSKSSSLRDRIGSLPRGLNLFNRPLPETPKTPSESSRSTTPKSVFDNIQRPPSVALEKIKSKANATLDRMQVLQQRYRQQKEQMERERCGSVTDQNMSAFDQWSSISQSPSHFRSGSISSGINSSHLDLVDDNNFNLFHQHPRAPHHHHHMTAQRANQLGQRGMSSSVFNLNQMSNKPLISSNGWMNNSMQQAQSMAQLNCANCGQHQLQWNDHNQHHHMRKTQDPWSNQMVSQQHLNRSNMSLNAPARFLMQPQMNNMYPPPAFMNQSNFMQPMYPQPYVTGMPVMNPGLMCMPPSTSRAVSRAGSRLASPAMSRKSVTLRRKQRSSYIDGEATDDEDSDEDDNRSITSIRSGLTRSRQRRTSSASQFQMDDDIDSAQAKLHRNRVRNQRRDSVAKSVHNDWAPGRKASSANNNRSADSGFNSPLKPSRIYSDLDSEGSGTRALVQAKIEQKLKEESLKQNQSRSKRQSRSPPPQKTSSAVQTPAVKQMKKREKTETHIQDQEKPVKQLLESEIEKEIGTRNISEPVEDLNVKARSTEAEEEVRSSNESKSESEINDESDAQHEMEENGNPDETEMQQDELGPPPSTPDHEWECEFCTFVNEANIKICSICCKTPSVQPKKAIKTVTPPKQLKIPKNQREKNERSKRSDKKPDKQTIGTIKKSPLTSSTPTSAQQIATTDNLTSKVMNHSVQNTDSSTETFQNKESIQDVWASLDENIQASANEVTLKAQSKKPVKDPSTPKSKIDLRQSQVKENGTTPSPQTFSTQTYDILPVQKTQARSESIVKPASQPSFDDVIQPTNFPLSPKIKDLQNFEAEVLNNIHNISHIPSHSHNRQINQPSHFYNERQRYRSSSDLHVEDTLSVDFDGFNGLRKGQLATSEQMMQQKTLPQTYSPYGGSIYDLAYHELSSVKPKDMENHKESDLYKHTTEELNAAIKYCGPDTHPLVWLRDNWPKLIQTVQSLATKYGQERAENTIGTISQMEARDALRMHTGNIWQAVSECIEQRQRKYREISSKGNFSREDIVTALTTHQGNVESALFDLGHTQLKPFLMRIWGSPGGVENESGFQPLPNATSSTTQIGMDRDIHNFLRANASECMQTPNSIGASLINNQTPSPYDRPDSFNSPFESINHTFDNVSSYSTDSKITAHSPTQLGESARSNKHFLKDLETLIGNMEQNQQKQNENVLRSIHDIITNISTKSENEYDPETMRILTKSPIIVSKSKTSSSDSNPENDNDIKNFVWQHIQEIMPNLVQQVELELVEGNTNGSIENEEKQGIKIAAEVNQNDPVLPPPPIDQDEFLMEEVIRPNIKKASIREELPPQYVYATEIASFKLTFDKALCLEHEEEFEFDKLAEAPKKIYQMFKSLKIENLQANLKFSEAELQSEVNSQGAEIRKPFPFEGDLRSLITNDPNVNVQTSEMISITRDPAAIINQSPLEKLTMSNEDTAESKRIRTQQCPRTLTRNNESQIFIGEHDTTNDKMLHYQDKNSNMKISENKSDEVSPSPSLKVTESIEAKSKDITSTSKTQHQTEKKQPQDLDHVAEPPKETNFLQQYGSETISASNMSDLGYAFQLGYQSKTKIPESNSNLAKSYTNSSIQFIQNEEHSIDEPASASNANKKISKIPVRRTASNKSLVNISTTKHATKTEISEIVNAKDITVAIKKKEYKDLQFPPNLAKLSNLRADAELEDADEKIADIEASKTLSEITSRLDQSQSSSTVNEIFLLTQAGDSENTSSIVPSTSNSTLHSTISQTSSFKPSSEFIPSGDPSKQNLTELVKDTQRLIQQMKDEISIDEFESSTDDGAYSDEFSDEYDYDGEEDWEAAEEEEEDEGDHDEDYDDLSEDFTAENEDLSIEEDSISKTQLPLPSEESQDRMAVQNSASLFLTIESLTHSPAFTNEHFEQNVPIEINNNDTNNQNTSIDKSAAVAGAENVANSLENSLLSLQFIESENNLADLPVEIVLSHQIKKDNETSAQNNFEIPHGTESKPTLDDVTIDKVLVSTSISNELILENSIPELPAEVVLVEEPIQHSHEDTQGHNHHEIVSNSSSAKSAQDDEAVPSDRAIVVSIKTNSARSFNDNAEDNTEDPVSTQNSKAKISSTSEENNLAVAQTDDFTNENVPSTISDNNNSPPSSDELNHSARIALENDNKLPSTSKAISAETKAKVSETAKTNVKKSTTASKIPKPKEVLKEQKQKETPIGKQQGGFKKKSYTRSKSFSGPTTPIGISSVKTISQKFISPLTSTQQKTAKKQPTVTRRSSIADAINKFTKPSTSAEKPAINAIFKSRTQPRIPKKKYHETCFSDDDYESSSGEEVEIEPLEVRQRKLSVPVFKAYPSIQEPDEVNTEELIEKFLKEELAKTVAEAQIAATLVSMKFPQDVSLWAAKECSDLDHAVALLRQECELCSGTYALNQIVSMLKCIHKCCKQCAKSYFTVQITERSINDCSCPFCKLPELHNQNEHEDENLEYFSNLDIFLKNIVEPEVHELFQRKLRDRTLLKDPNFKWCVQCSSGFFARPKQKRLICPDCGSVTCAQCRKTWQKQHEGISCEQFSKWESANDPEVQAKGVQQHLEQNGIDCPKCKFKYSLARGGCMHFTCTQCKFEFCYGCAKPFMMGAKCTISPYCAKLGLHAHHPRNCLFYLRDKLPIQLQILLKNNNVSYAVDPSEGSEDNDDNEPSSSKKKELLCPIPLQKETPTGLVDTRCNGDVPEKHAGMCRNHYVEYLTAKVARSKIDPLPIFDLTDCVQELRRRGLPLPERGPWDTDEIYKNMCAEVIKDKIPLDMA